MKQNTTQIQTIRDVREQDALIEAILDSGEIGTLCRQGKTIFYANLSPLHLGLTVEGATKAAVAYKLLAIASR